MKDKKSFGRFIAEKRKEKGMTQAEVAQALYVTVTAVSKWERGVTYPDITLISDLCEILGVSEHELITAGNDAEYRRMKAEAERYRKISDAWFYGLTGTYLLALVVCFICNLAIDKTLSWFFIVLTSLLTAFSLFPSWARFFKKGKLLAVSASFTASLLLLLLACCVYVRGDWFFTALTAILFAYAAVFLPILLALYPVPRAIKKNNPIISVGVDFLLLLTLIFSCYYEDMSEFLKGVKIAAFCFAPVFASAAILSYLKGNGWIKAACMCVLWGAFTFGANAVISLLLGDSYAFKMELTDWSETYLNGNIVFVVWLVSFLVALAFLVVGIVRERRKAKRQG